MIINLNLPEDFYLKIKETMEDEIKVASKKWGVSLSKDKQDLIITHSQNQLRKKVSESAKTNWDYSSTISIKVIASKAVEINIPENTLTESKIKLVSTREGWEIDKESRDDAVRINDFLDYFVAKVHKWARDAVFYGVGSYAQ